MADIRRDEQKLWLILFQIKGLRARLNFLAFQHWVFSTLAILIGGAALVFAAAFMISPLKFLLVAITAVVFGLIGLARAARWAIGSRVTPERAAAIADERAALKGRLTTVLAIADLPKNSPLWPYLVEDTYGLRETFEPGRIEPRWLSRSAFALVAALGLAMLLIPFALTHRGGPRRGLANRGPGEITADIGNLDIRPADPALEPNAEILADDATLRKLQEKLSAEQNGDAAKGGLSRWMDKARNLAGDLQGDLTGRKRERQPLRLKLTDRNPSKAGPGAGKSGPPADGDQNKPGGGIAAQSSGGSGGANSQSQPPTSLPQDEADQLAQNGRKFPRQPGPDPGHPDQSNSDTALDGGDGAGAGSSHGAGSDPEHLFGPPSTGPIGSNGFRITIDAQPSDESSTPGAPAYIPPKIRVPLNSTQYPDEPLARAAVPVSDQLTVKRVFER